MRHATRECEIQKQLSHPRIVRLRDVFELSSEGFCTVLDYCDGGDLEQLLKAHKTLPGLNRHPPRTPLPSLPCPRPPPRSLLVNPSTQPLAFAAAPLALVLAAPPPSVPMTGPR